jgi:hypothetical protein
MSSGLSRYVLGAGLAFTVPAWSADAPERGWLVEANVLEARSSDGKAPFTFDGEESAVSFGGGYAFNKYFALQGTYHDFGEHAATDCPAPVCTAVPHGDLADIRGLSIAAVGTWHVSPSVELFGKLGVLGWRADFERAGFDETDRGALAGVGVGISATPQWRINVQYERADFDLESAGVGVTYRF